MFKYLTLATVALVSTAEGSQIKQQLQVNTLNQVILELDMLEKAKLNSGLEVELLDFLQQEMESGALSKMKEEHKSSLLGDTVVWLKKRFTNKPY